jgi:ATP-dependent helicase HrpA
MSESNFIAEQTKESFLSVFPDTVQVQNNKLGVNYSFQPGADNDGATIEVPVSLLPQLKQSDLDWAIPGLVTERCQCLIKGLPKTLRKGFVPVNKVVEELLEGVSYKDGPLLQVLIRAAKSYRNITLSYEDLNAISPPSHLIVKVSVLDHNAKQIAFGSSIDQLKRDLELIDNLPSKGDNLELKESFQLHHPIVRDRAVDWDFGDFPDHVTLGGSLKIIRYPCVLDYDEYVSIELWADSCAAREKSRYGFATLFMLRTVKQKNYLCKKFSKLVKDFTLLIPVELATIARDAVCVCYLETFHLNHDFPQSKDTFDYLLLSNKERLVTVGDELERKLTAIFLLRKKVLHELTGAKEKMTADDIRDVETQICNLFCQNFIVQAGTQWLAEYPRYLNAILIRLQKIIARSLKKAQYTDQLLQYQLRFQNLLERNELVKRREIIQLGWMIEEYRVSCYAQHLRTKISVSDKKLEKAFANLE